MKVRTTDKRATDKRATEIEIMVAEKVVLQKANRLLQLLAKFHGGAEETAAAAAIAPVAARWAPEEAVTNENK